MKCSFHMKVNFTRNYGGLRMSLLIFGYKEAFKWHRVERGCFRGVIRALAWGPVGPHLGSPGTCYVPWTSRWLLCTSLLACEAVDGGRSPLWAPPRPRRPMARFCYNRSCCCCHTLFCSDGPPVASVSCFFPQIAARTCFAVTQASALIIAWCVMDMMTVEIWVMNKTVVSNITSLKVYI